MKKEKANANKKEEKSSESSYELSEEEKVCADELNQHLKSLDAWANKDRNNRTVLCIAGFKTKEGHCDSAVVNGVMNSLAANLARVLSANKSGDLMKLFIAAVTAVAKVEVSEIFAHPKDKK